MQKLVPQAGDDTAQTALSQRRSSAEGPARILLVEDDDLVRDHARGLLEGMGYAVHAEADPSSALSVVEAGSEFDLLFTDIVMPGEMNGLELARAVRALRPDIAVLCTSGYAGSVLDDVTGEAADFGFVRKPYRRAELLRHLRTKLG
ncbi:response regulator [Alkalilacustris brevis]|uniref:response regulator n=1 Tax=Alkalilacustris brevis TaxID=2026338 RepID=UPI001390232B|nr:response regulator [Alkalilacustris brevis]